MKSSIKPIAGTVGLIVEYFVLQSFVHFASKEQSFHWIQGILINQWSMNWGQPNPVCYPCLVGCVVASWSLTQEVASSNKVFTKILSLNLGKTKVNSWTTLNRTAVIVIVNVSNMWTRKERETCGTLSSLMKLLSLVCFDFSVSEWRAQLFLMQAAVLEQSVIQFVAMSRWMRKLMSGSSSFKV